MSVQEPLARLSFERRILPGIEILRGCAALFVLLFHYKVPTGILIIDLIWEPFRQFGWTGVDLFFVISGFCIHWGYGEDKHFKPLEYIWRRFRRIYPPYFFALLFAILGLSLGVYLRSVYGGKGPSSEALSLKQILTHLLLLHNFWPETSSGVNPVFWTIAIEIQFYLVYMVFRPLMRGWRWIITIALSVVLFSVALLISTHGIPEFWNVFKYWDEWVLGAAIADIYRRKPSSSKWWLPVSGGAVLLVGISYIMTSTNVIFRLLWAGGYALIMLGFLWKSQPPQIGWTARPFIFLGVISYSVYLIHLMLVQHIEPYFILKIEPGLLRLSGSMLGLATILAACYGFHLLFERPFLNIKRHLLAKGNPDDLLIPLNDLNVRGGEK